ncbi:branched-chain amino acid aminotransferase [Cytobacillus solani]|uniref:branched-chain amino acid aminotransferase n=1 Tax=Cytobacillus solani TaxID=1637975 RepID=UPI00207A237F|nr:branched-chain amino acid aminotransferase [Cytobacillus solani]USK52768.1 branched-chain amino acid aminotransferase [Cytobacillus solani]
MLHTKITNYFSDEKTASFKEEIEYARKHQIIDETRTIMEIDPAARFNDAYIERSDKETEEFLGEESAGFLNQPIHYLKQYLNEFIYIESDCFPMIHTESICLEVDDIFRTYEVMLGLKLQKKYKKGIKAYLEQELIGEIKVSLLFNQTDGLWDFNFALNNIKGFNEDLTIGEVLVLVYRFLFKLAETVEENK